MAFRGIRFCRECDNMLYPKERTGEDKIGHLIYDCRICGYFERAKPGNEADNCVYKSEFSKMSEKFNVDPECVKDPTLSRTKNIRCMNKKKECDGTEAVTFTNPTKERMNLIYVCTKCTFHWRKEELDPNNDVMSDLEDEKK